MTKIKRFNSRLYFYYINNKINPSTVVVNLSKIPLIIIKGQSHIKLPKELWDKTEQMERYKRTMSLESRQPNASHTAQTGGKKQSHLIRTGSPCLPSRVYSKGKERMQLPTAPSF